MGMGTAGAVLDAIARMRRAEREMARNRPGRVRPPRRRDGGVPDRLPFPCFFLCDTCGRLEEGPSDDPMRRDGNDGGAPGPCPACNATAWVDLRRQSNALAYREAEMMDSSQRNEQSRRRRLWIGGITSTAVTTAVVLWGITLADLGGAALRGMVIVVFPVVWVAASLGVRLLTRRSRTTPSRPQRWRHPLPRARAPRRRRVQGMVRGDASLCAPLSQQPCIGWVVQIWSDGVQLLDEQHHVALGIAGEAFEADSVRLELVAREHEPRPGDEAFARFLQRRGLSPHVPSLRVREALLVPGAIAEVEPGDPEGLVLSASARALAA